MRLAVALSERGVLIGSRWPLWEFVVCVIVSHVEGFMIYDTIALRELAFDSTPGT